VDCLNPALYKRLQALYGKVLIYKPGQHMQFNDFITYRTVVGKQLKLEIDKWGEQYKIQCPYCQDHQPRAYISYMYGKTAPDGRAIYLAKCWNEECFKEDDLSQHFRDRVMAFHNGRPLVMTSAAESWEPARPQLPFVARLPSNLESVADLWVSKPRHPAVIYMRDEREYTLDMVRKYDLRFCAYSPEFPSVTNRVIIPCYKQGQLWGWQSRAIVENPGKMKYFNLPDWPKQDYCYNFDVARNSPILTLVEGSFSVHHIGDGAAALLGKTLSPKQLQLLATTCQNKEIVVWMDLDAQKYALNICEELLQVGLSVRNLNPGTALDPADYKQEVSLELIAGALSGPKYVSRGTQSEW
jgi:hypothetical protein